MGDNNIRQNEIRSLNMESANMNEKRNPVQLIIKRVIRSIRRLLKIVQEIHVFRKSNLCKKSDSPRSNGTDIQTDQQCLEVTYDIPLDMPQRMSSQLDLEPINTINFDGNEKEFVQQQQLWLLNGRISPQNIDRILTTPQTRTTGEDVTREPADHTIFESFPNEIQSNIYMEVDSSEQLKS